MKTVDKTIAYRTLYRPPMFGGLPDVWWEWAKVPTDLAPMFPELPVSDHLYGEFHTERPLTDDEMRSFQIEKVAPAAIEPDQWSVDADPLLEKTLGPLPDGLGEFMEQAREDARLRRLDREVNG